MMTVENGLVKQKLRGREHMRVHTLHYSSYTSGVLR